jgi:hypothetical protein
MATTDEDEPPSESTTTLKKKVWRFQVVQEFTDNLLIRTCLEIVEGGLMLRLCEIHYQVFERYHARMENQTTHRRPEELLHPHKLLECTAFSNQQDWDAWKASTKHGLGKASTNDFSAGLLKEEHAEWASRKWEKYVMKPFLPFLY